MIWARHLKLFTKVGAAALVLGALAPAGTRRMYTKTSSRCHLRLTGEAPHCRQAIIPLLWLRQALHTLFTFTDRQGAPSSRPL